MSTFLNTLRILSVDANFLSIFNIYCIKSPFLKQKQYLYFTNFAAFFKSYKCMFSPL